MKLEWDDDAESGFVDWFHGNMTDYTWRSEWFYGDCAVEDLKTRESIMHKWLHTAFTEGYKLGTKNKK